MEGALRITALFAIFCQVLTFSCKNNPRQLQVHLIPHTHDDVGWLKTVDEYYYGANNTIQHAGVQYILDSVIPALLHDKEKTFIYVEMAFFHRWWNQQSRDMQDIVRELVRRRQLEFINGGWCMNDEAATHYTAIIDQMTVGLRFINDTFGPDARPTIAWHIDPFGHSAEQASLFSLMSFDGFFFGRIDYADKDKRLKEKRMELVWRGSRNYGDKSQIFTGVLYNGYNPPDGFCFDQFCDYNQPIQDDPNLFDMNVKEKVDKFVEESCTQAEHYRTENIAMTMGSDFMYENANLWYKNLDKLIHYVNKDGRVKVFYSSPSRYLDALHKAGLEWEVKTDDFFPYAHCPHCYWTGYFTSRPALKRYIRQSNNLLQVCKQLEVEHGPFQRYPSSITLGRAMAVNQHHDAVTGTEKQHVAYDYAKRLAIGEKECQDLTGKVLSALYTMNPAAENQLVFCNRLNVSICPFTQERKSFVINTYNPLARQVEGFIEVPMTYKDVTVVDPAGRPVQSQLIPVSKQLKRQQYRVGQAQYNLVFPSILPALGFSTYLVNNTGSRGKDKAAQTSSSSLAEGNNFIENEFLRVTIDVDSGRISKVVRKDTGLSIDIDQQFFWYKGSTGNAESRQTSGAYIFRPNVSDPFEINDGNVAKTELLKGPVCEILRQSFSSYVSQDIRLCVGQPFVEFEYLLGPIPVDDKVGKEIITRFDTNIASNSLYYTDANGREIKERKRDYRPTWTLNKTEPVSENYYPINSRIFIRDSKSQLTVMTDRSHGGGSINDGSLEVMLHRRLLVDDFLGVDEALNEPGLDGRGLIVKGKLRLFLATPQEAPRLHRDWGERIFGEPLNSFTESPKDLEQWWHAHRPVYKGLRQDLPENVHLLTVETIDKNTMILRLEHTYEKGEDAKLSQPVTVSLKDLFTAFEVISLKELNLAANQELSKKKMMNWHTYGVPPSGPLNEYRYEDGLHITLNPMEIRTFKANIIRKT